MDTDFSGLEALPRTPLALMPTPVVPMPRLSAELGGPELFVKRDDLTGIALGGNKLRKLEFLLGEAAHRGADTILTAGALDSNHCRQTAAAAAFLGLECHLLLGGSEPRRARGNYLLDILLGANIHWGGANRKGEDLEALYEKLKSQGKTPALIPYGGSNEIGAAGFLWASLEMHEQNHAQGLDLTHVVFASSSGGTQAGLELGRRALDSNIEMMGIRIDKEEDSSYRDFLVELAERTARTCGLSNTFKPRHFTVIEDYMGPGYGNITDAEKEAIHLCAQLEGILLDPVYTGRAMAGLIDLIRKNILTDDHKVLFWHTGGTPSLFTAGEEIL